MTAPTIEQPTTAELPDGPIPDDLLSQALTARAESTGMGLDEPVDEAPTPPADAAPDKVTDDADEVTNEVPAPTDAAPADQPGAVDVFAALPKDATPLAYTVNGVARSSDLILEVPGKGALIPADKLHEVRNVLARYESNEALAKEWVAERKQYDALGGVAKFHELSERNAQLNAASLLILNALENPRALVHDDGTPNRAAIDFLLREAKVAATEAKFAALTERQTAVSTRTQQETAETVRQTAVPSILSSDPVFRDVHPADRAFLERNASTYLFEVTPATAAQFGHPAGTLLVDRQRMKDDVDDRVAIRREAEASASKKAAAAVENARRTAVPPTPKPKAKVAPRDPNTGQFAERPKLDRSTIFERAMAGKPVSGAADYDE